MKSGKFYIAIYSHKTMSKAKHQVEGWIDGDNMIGYHKNEEDEWVATAIESGRSICKCWGDIVLCFEELEKLYPKVEEMRENKDYIDFCKKFESFPIE